MYLICVSLVSTPFFCWILKLCDILFCFSFIIKVLLDNVLSVVVELWVTLRVKLGNKNTKSIISMFNLVYRNRTQNRRSLTHLTL